MTAVPMDGQPRGPAGVEGVTEAPVPGVPATVTATLDVDARRLLWRCRRGMKELDVVLDRFARAELPGYSTDERRIFAAFLELPDPVINEYLLGYVIPPEPELAQLVDRIVAPTLKLSTGTPAPNPMAPSSAAASPPAHSR
jgi:antitoxin CptB